VRAPSEDCEELEIIRTAFAPAAQASASNPSTSHGTHVWLCGARTATGTACLCVGRMRGRAGAAGT